MDQKTINANVYLLLQDLCKHCMQTKQEPHVVLGYFVDQKKKGFEFLSFSNMISKIFPNTTPQLHHHCFKFISEKYQSNLISIQQIVELLFKIKNQMSEQELYSPIQSKIVINSSSKISGNMNNSQQAPQIQVQRIRQDKELVDLFMKNLEKVQINLLDLFQKFDSNKDNQMNQNEFVEMFSKVIKDLNQQEYSILINYFFRDGRELTAFQFKKLCQIQQNNNFNIMESNYFENPANANLLRSNIQFSELHVDDLNLVAMNEFIQRFDQLRRDQQLYTDRSFPPNQKSLGNIKTAHNFEWKRISQLSRDEPKFFVKENSGNRFGIGKWICPDDLIQGCLGDCYFLASISSLGNRRPDLLLNVFITRTYNPNGLYGVKLCVDGEWKVIGIDDYIPTVYNKPAFTRGKDSEIWVMIIEKAWAKIFSSYENIEAGYPTEVLNCLTGAPTDLFFTDDEKFLQKLQECINQRCIMVCATKKQEEGDIKESGLIPQHAYTVLKIKNLNANTQLIKLRNPWGKQEWKGQWSDSSPLWTPQLRKQFKLTNDNDGVFYMNIPDFIKYFDNISVCYVKDGYKQQSINLETNNKNSIYINVSIQVDGFYYFTVNQKNKRFENAFEYSPIRILLVADNEFLDGKCIDKRETWLGKHLKRGQHTIIIKTIWKYSKTNKITFSSYGPGQVQIQRIPKIVNLINNVIIKQARNSKKLKPYEKCPEIIKAYDFFTDYGYGFIYCVNNSNSSFETQMTFNKFEGLKLRKPLRGFKLEFSLSPKEEFLAVVSVSNKGFSFGMEERFIVK